MLVVHNVNAKANDGVVCHLGIAVEVVLKIPLAPLPTEKMEN